MTNIFKTPEKVHIRDRLFDIGVEALQKEGWRVERIPRVGKSSVRRITKGNESRVVAIRTTQNTWTAFPRNKDDTAWRTLSDVDVVVVVSVDSANNPQFAQAHIIEGDEMRARFDRAYAARLTAGRKIPVGRGVWISLYDRETDKRVDLVGAGAGIDNPMIARVPLTEGEQQVDPEAELEAADDHLAPLTIPEAKQRLARTLGVPESCIKIIVDA